MYGCFAGMLNPENICTELNLPSIRIEMIIIFAP